ncbi:MAG: response regulator transcription factor [Acidimicrobiales bacterium]
MTQEPTRRDVETSPVTVVVVDDHTMFRESLRMALSDTDGIEVVGAVASLHEARREVDEKRPTVALLDYALSDGTGVELATWIHEHCSEVATMVLTASEGVQAAAEAVAAGCGGFLRKSADVTALRSALLRVGAGEAAFDAQTLAAAVTWLNQAPPTAPVQLSDREQEILELLAEGRTTAEMADLLVLSHHTVRNHVRNLLGKLDARSQLEALVLAASMGLVEVGRPLQ